MSIDDPSQLLFIDDHDANIEAAHRLGWQGVHFRSSAQVEVELCALGW